MGAIDICWYIVGSVELSYTFQAIDLITIKDWFGSCGFVVFSYSEWLFLKCHGFW